MFFFFDYIYLKVFQFYSEIKDVIPKFTAVLIVSGMQSLNIFIVIEIITLFTRHKFLVKLPSVIILMTAIIIVNFFRYKRIHDKIITRWQEESNKRNMAGNIITVAYIALTMILFIGMAIYIGNKKW